MKEKDLIEFLTFIAEEDAQISTIVHFFVNELGYSISIIKRIINYGIINNIFLFIKNINNYNNYEALRSDEIENVDLSASNTLIEIHYNDFDHYRKVLFVPDPQVPIEFRQFITSDNT